MLLISQDTDLEAVARNVAQPAKQRSSFSVADLALIPPDPDAGSVADPVPFKPLDPASEIGKIRIRNQDPDPG
jgi:hypothetical protein